MSELRRRLESLSRGELAGLATVLVAVLLGSGLWYVRSLPRPVLVAATPGPSSVPSPAATPSATVSPGAQELVVDVTGWVRRPGVYRFQPGDRIIDAVEAAGGARSGAQLSSLNLAAPLADGQQILVPKEGEAPVGAVGTGGTGTTGATGTIGAAGGLVNVNTADAAALETLNGVGPVLAEAIIQYRTENGPFTTVDQLDEVSGIGIATLELIRDQVTV